MYDTIILPRDIWRRRIVVVWWGRRQYNSFYPDFSSLSLCFFFFFFFFASLSSYLSFVSYIYICLSIGPFIYFLTALHAAQVFPCPFEILGAGRNYWQRQYQVFCRLWIMVVILLWHTVCWIYSTYRCWRKIAWIELNNPLQLRCGKVLQLHYYTLFVSICVYSYTYKDTYAYIHIYSIHRETE